MPAQATKLLEFRHRVTEEDQGFTHVPNTVLLDSRLPAMVRLCYSIIKSYAFGQKCESFPSQKTLAEQLGVKERSIRYYLEELEILGLITTEQRGLGKTNVYWIESLAGLDERVKKYLQWKADKQKPRQPVASQERQYIAGQERQPASGPGGNTLPTNNTKKKNTTEERNTLAPIAQSRPQPPPDQAITKLNASLKQTAEAQNSQREEPERKVPPKESPRVKPDDWFVVAGDVAHGSYPSYEAAKRGADEHQGTVTQGQVIGDKTIRPVPKATKPAFVFSPEVKDAFAILCYGTATAWEMDANAKAMMGALKKLSDPTLDRLRLFWCNWHTLDFRGKQGQKPKPYQVVNEWTVYTTEDCREAEDIFGRGVSNGTANQTTTGGQSQPGTAIPSGIGGTEPVLAQRQGVSRTGLKPPTPGSALSAVPGTGNGSRPADGH